jgi:hypothetical protein
VADDIRDDEDAIDPETGVAYGDRREGVHYAPDPGQIARAVHQVKPTGPLPEDERSTEDGEHRPQPKVPVQDVRVTPTSASVWEARSEPPQADEDRR